jgi:hypothetical protein
MNKATIKHRLAATLATILIVTGTSSCGVRIAQPGEGEIPRTCPSSGELSGSMSRVPMSTTAWTGASSTGFCTRTGPVVLTSLRNPNNQKITLAMTNADGQVTGGQLVIPAGGTVTGSFNIDSRQNWAGSIGWSVSPPETFSFGGTWTT